jgi:hypothetical protein
MNKEQKGVQQQISLTLWTLGAAVAGGELVAAAAVRGRGYGWVAMLWGGAFTVMGFVLGFLFGVPRVQTPDDNSKSPLQANTNLEQISDWLTKLLTGAALASLKDCPATSSLVRPTLRSLCPHAPTACAPLTISSPPLAARFSVTF